MSNAIVASPAKLSTVIGELREAFRKHGWLSVSWRNDKDRSLQQNALAFAWYGQIADELRENTTEGVHAECKLRYGVPILRAEDADFRAMYDAAIKGIDYETKLKVMAYLPVTRIMTTGQLSQYLEAIREAYDGRVALEFPADTGWAA